MEWDKRGEESPQQWERDRGSLLALLLCETDLEREGLEDSQVQPMAKRGADHTPGGDQGLQRQNVNKTPGHLHTHGEKQGPHE